MKFKWVGNLISRAVGTKASVTFQLGYLLMGCLSCQHDEPPFVLTLFKVSYVLPLSAQEALAAHGIPYRKGENKQIRRDKYACDEVSVSYLERSNSEENLRKPIWGYSLSYPKEQISYEEVKRQLEAQVRVPTRATMMGGIPAHVYTVSDEITVVLREASHTRMNTPCLENKNPNKGFVQVHLCYDLAEDEVNDFVVTDGRQIWNWFD